MGSTTALFFTLKCALFHPERAQAADIVWGVIPVDVTQLAQLALAKSRLQSPPPAGAAQVRVCFPALMQIL